jgi:hypothetical protein
VRITVAGKEVKPEVVKVLNLEEDQGVVTLTDEEGYQILQLRVNDAGKVVFNRCRHIPSRVGFETDERGNIVEVEESRFFTFRFVVT